MKMEKVLLIISLTVLHIPALLARPSIAEIIEINKSLVRISTEYSNGNTGRGSGVVISKEYVATNCHVIANATGVNITKRHDGYKPIAIKADWKRDLCLLKFKDLPFKAVPMRNSASLKDGEEVTSLGYPLGNNVPQPSYGKVKATYPFDGNLIIRTDAAFALGSSGGALFDSQFNLIGITTFKSPGNQAFFYNLPTDWIKQLIDSPDLFSLKTNEVPFWALPLAQRPYFMQVVIPFQNQEWDTLKRIAQQWSAKEPSSPDAWHFLGLAEEGKGQLALAEVHLKKAKQLRQR